MNSGPSDKNRTSSGKHYTARALSSRDGYHVRTPEVISNTALQKKHGSNAVSADKEGDIGRRYKKKRGEVKIRYLRDWTRRAVKNTRGGALMLSPRFLP